MGFIPGAYQCICKAGFYFPEPSAQLRAYSGEDIENHVRQTGVIEHGMFRCIVCAEGCDTCIDDSTCLYQRNEALFISLLILNLVTVAGITCIAVVTYLYRREMVSIILTRTKQK